MEEDKNPFESVEFGPVQAQLSEQVRSLANDLYMNLKSIPAGRELSLAMTHLEETVMWANKAISKIPKP